MDRERAETYLRLLAEAELRRVATFAAGALRGRWRPAKLELAVQALRAAGAVGVDVADEIQADLGLALAGRYRLAVSRTGRPGSGAMPRRASCRVVPVGQVIKVRSGGLSGELLVVACVQSAGGARLIVVGGPVPPLAAADDHGVSYQIGWSGGHTASQLLLRPAPSHQIRWLDVTGAVEAGTRINLDRQIPRPEVTVTPGARNPGELLLEVIAARILSLVACGPDNPGPPAAGADLRAFIGDVPGHIVAALHGAGVLCADSPVPGHLAGLCARLGIDGHGITAPPGSDLPEQWENLLSPWRRAAGPAAGILAATMAELPGPDGAAITIAGLTHSLLPHGEPRTLMHLLASGVTQEDDWNFARGVIPLPVLWIRDSNSRWHTTRTDSVSPWSDAGVIALWLEIIPPLERGTASIEISAASPSAQARVTLPLSSP